MTPFPLYFDSFNNAWLADKNNGKFQSLLFGLGKTQASSVLFLPKSMSGFQLKGATLSLLVCETLKKAIVAHPWSKQQWDTDSHSVSK